LLKTDFTNELTKELLLDSWIHFITECILTAKPMEEQLSYQEAALDIQKPANSKENFCSIVVEDYNKCITIFVHSSSSKK
jgi:hypothetical protein